ncbi:alpha-L-rhamnosidase A [Verticillium dahliae]|nr:alpha-L-rhamnosidase A [Verticillium dahliae]
MATIRRLAAFILLLVSSVDVRAKNIDYAALPDETLFPGPWERYIKAPADKTRITPARILTTFGDVTTSSATPRAVTPGDHVPGQGILIGPEGLLTLEFDENTGGRRHRVCFDVESVGDDPELYLSYSESPLLSGKLPDATTDRSHGDLPLQIEFGTQTGVVCVGKDFVRGGFKYLTIRMPVYPVLGSGPAPFSHRDVLPGQHVLSPGVERRKSDRDPYATPWVSIRNLWVDCTAFPSQAQGRAYSGYFFSSSNLLNRIWYAGAYTLQLSTLDPSEGSSMIDYNRLVDNNKSPAGSCVAKIDSNTNLLPGQQGHSLEASALLSVVLDRTMTLARWLGDNNDGTTHRPDDYLWAAARAALHKGIQSLYCPTTHLHAANLVESRRCPDPDHLAPQAGNAWALIAGAAAHPSSSSSSSSSVSRALSARWLPAGAPAPETPGLLSPLASSLELAAHAAARLGGFVWDDDRPGIEFSGGKTVAFIVWEDRVGSAPPVEELDVSPGRRTEADCEEEWYLQVFLYRNDMRLVYDKAFTALP